MHGSTSVNDGFVIIPKGILNNTALTPDAVILYARLLHYDRGKIGLGCIAKRCTLGKICGFSIHRVRRAVKLLEDEGIISVIRRRNGLTDRIRITPDCRPPTKTIKAIPKSNRGKKKRVAESSSLKEVPNIKLSSLKANKTKQGNKRGLSKITSSPSTDKPETPQKQPSKTPIESTPPLTPIPKHQPATERLHDDIKGVIRPYSYSYWWEGKTAIENEDANTITIRCIDDFTADWLQTNYLTLVEGISGKKVKFTDNSNQRSDDG